MYFHRGLPSRWQMLEPVESAEPQPVHHELPPQPEPEPHRWELSNIAWDPFSVVCHDWWGDSQPAVPHRAPRAPAFPGLLAHATPRGLSALTQAAEVAPSERLDDAAALLPPLLGLPEADELVPAGTTRGRAKRVSRLAARPKCCIVDGCVVRLEEASRYLQRVRCVSKPSLPPGGPLGWPA